MSDQIATATPSQAVSTYALFIRWVVTVHLIALAAQFALAISFVAGVGSALPTHMSNAKTVTVLGLLQAVLLVRSRLRGVHRSMAVAVVLFEAAQIYFGNTLGLWAHTTTAMLIWAFSLTLSIKVWDPTWKHPA